MQKPFSQNLISGHITAVFTYKWVGEDFAKLVDEGKDLTVTIAEGMRGGRVIGNINR